MTVVADTYHLTTFQMAVASAPPPALVSRPATDGRQAAGGDAGGRQGRCGAPAEASPAGHPARDASRGRTALAIWPRVARPRTGSEGQGAPGQRLRLETRDQRMPRSARPAPPPLLCLLMGREPERAAREGCGRPRIAEGPGRTPSSVPERGWGWRESVGLPIVVHGPASLAKVVMAELASLKLDNEPWPGEEHWCLQSPSSRESSISRNTHRAVVQADSLPLRDAEIKAWS
ncbi:uncharacterized protein LOC123623619 [Lemur catta]|uniref:uncharacterized protein LOC123623619 n=1 Tax=Lemur catta TaxID=9447 RepID=UPI001E26D9DE|nr:uncharacterized protein LOC123623619 [Lemur catta]